MYKTEINHLPVPTWNQLGVNSASAAAALPAVPADDWGDANIAVTLPAGIGEAEEGFTSFSESGMGQAVDTYLLENATIRNTLTVAENTTVAEPAIFEATLDAAHPNALSVLDVDAKVNSQLTVVQVVRGDAENGVGVAVAVHHADGGGELFKLGGSFRGSLGGGFGRSFGGGFRGSLGRGLGGRFGRLGLATGGQREDQAERQRNGE